jgi:hypothetical protein
LIDRSGYGNHGTLTNMDAGTDWVGSRYGWALDLDGSDDFVSITDNDALSGLSTMTISAWVNIRALPAASLGQRMWIATKGALANFEWELSVNAFRDTFIPFGRYCFTAYNLDASILIQRGSNTAASAGAWQHIVATLSSRSVAPDVYFNGVLDNGGSAVEGTATAGNGTANVDIGRRGATENRFNGLIDDLRIYNRALTPTEIRLLATEPGIGLKPERTSVFFGADLFSAAWIAKSSSIIGGGVA